MLDSLAELQDDLMRSGIKGNYTPRENLPAAAYNAEKDITKIPDLAAESYITCQPGMMAIFFPQDGHAPCITGAPEIKKAIFKVKA